MTDFASLGIKIDSSSVPKAVGDLDRLTAAGTRAEAATLKLGGTSKAAAVGAAAIAAQAQASARGTLSMGAGATAASTAMQSLGTHTRGSALQIRESLVLMREASVGNFTRMAGSASILAGSLATTGTSFGALVTRLLTMVGVLKVTENAELALAAADAAAGAAGVKSAAERATASIVAADTQLALAQAEVRVAATSEAATVAQVQLAAAHEAVAAAAVQATIAENALAVAEGRAGAAAEAAAAATVTSLGPIAGVLAGVAIATGLLIGSFKAFQAQVRNDRTLENYANSLGLTKKEMKALRQEVGGLSSKEMKDLDERARAFEITWGDVFHGLAKTASDALDLSPAWQAFSKGYQSAFAAALGHAINFAAKSYGYVVGAYRTIVQTYGGLAQAIGRAFNAAASVAVIAIQELVNKGIDALNFFANGANQILGKNLLGTVGHVDLGIITSNYGEAGKKAGKSFAENVASATAEAQAQISKNVATIYDNIIGAAKKRIKDAADTIIEDRSPKKAKKQSDHGLADALATLDAQIKGQLRLAEAYQVSDEAALRAEALQKAEEQAIRHKGDVGLFYAKELALAAAKGAADGGKQIADLSAETAAQKAVNDAVSAGVLDAERASEVLADEAKIRPLLAAQAVAEGAAKKILTDIIEGLRKKQQEANFEAARAQVLAETAAGSDQLDRLKLEARLIGETNAVRAVAIAQLEAEQFIRAHPGASADEAQRYVETQKQIAQQTADLSTAQDNYNNSLSYTADLLDQINQRAQQTGDALANAFGTVGQGISTALTALTGYAATQAKIDQDHAAALKAAGGDAKAMANEEILYAKKSSIARQAATMQVLAGLKGLFKEHSTGYKVMTAIEKAYAIFQAATAAIAIARDIAHTISSLANSATRTAANTAEGGSKIFAQLGVWAFPVVAAMVAVLAALGAKGGGGGGGGAVPTSPDDLQAAAGAGSVLGDSKAKSDSIRNSLEIVAANSNKDLEYSNSMLSALRNIDLGISKMAGIVARQIQVSGSLFDTSGLGLGASGSSGFLGLFASQTTKTLYDLGINLASATVGSIINGGIGGSTYQTVEKIKKKSGFLGIGGGTKTTYQTTTGQIDPEITAAIQSVIMSLRDGLVAASKVIGLDGAAAILDSFQVSIGKVSFKDMTGQEIEDTLNAIFSKVGDQMAAALFPTLTTLQKVGEGLFETFLRVAREYQVVDVALQSIGKTFGAVGIASLEARDNLVQLFGSLDDFVSATEFFRDQFLTVAEQIAPVQAAVTAEMTRLGLAGITTREQFKNVVLGLDLTTQAGRDMYAALLAVAPAFDKVLDYFDQANKAMIDSLQSTADKFNGFAASLQKYRDTLFATDAAQGASYATLRARFASTAALAATGDATALGGLEGAGKDFLTSARNNASSLQAYLRDVAMVARGVDKGIFAATETADYAELQLAALKNSVTILSSIAANTAATAAALGAPISTPAGVATPAGVGPVAINGAGDPALAAEIAALRTDLNAALQAIAASTGSTDRTLKRWDDGEAMKITTPDGAPLDVNLESWG